jgi:hypothetical protein
MFNPDCRIELVPIPGHLPCVVVDDFLEAPELLVQGAMELRSQFRMAQHNAFPGLEYRMPDAFSARINEFFIQHVKRHLGARRVLELYSRLSMVTLQPEDLSPFQRLCHRDKFTNDPVHCFAASVLYLFKDPAMGGTSFYRPKLDDASLLRMYAMDSEWRSMSRETCTERLGCPPAYLTSSNDYFELIATVPAAWNRAIFYDGTIFHTGHLTVPQLLSDDPMRGRLTLNSFLTCRSAL